MIYLLKKLSNKVVSICNNKIKKNKKNKKIQQMILQEQMISQILKLILI